MPAHKVEIVFITVVNEVKPDEVKPGITGPPARSCQTDMTGNITFPKPRLHTVKIKQHIYSK